MLPFQSNTLNEYSQVNVQCCCHISICKLITASGEHGPRCLQCSTVEDPSHCGAVVECAVGQVIIRKLYSIITLLTCFHHSSIHVLVHIEPVYP